MKNRYYVHTWDPDTKEFTPQNGVRVGPWSKWGLRKALRSLQDMGYETTRAGGFCVLVWSDKGNRA